MAKYNFALVNWAEKKPLQVPVVARNFFNLIFYYHWRDLAGAKGGLAEGANPSTIRISQCVLWMIQKDQLAPQ